MQKSWTKSYIDILKEELVLALGCTEPIAIAYGAANVKKLLKNIPESIHIEASANLIKNIQSVVIPNTGGMVGMKPAIIAGLMAKDINNPLEILSQIKKADHHDFNILLQKHTITISKLNSDHNLHFIITGNHQNDSVKVEIKHLHTNITNIIVNGHETYSKEDDHDSYEQTRQHRDALHIDAIYDFANTVDLKPIKSLLSAQIKHNMAIANDGLDHDYAINIGRIILETDHSIEHAIKAYSASASEARMCGSPKAVMTNSGSGNQGITSSVPVIVFANEKKLSDESLYRALILSNLLTIHQKTKIGRLSAFCGAISACASTAAAFVYLENGTVEQIKMALINTLADAAGVICDGAKASCAAKITTGLDAALLGYRLAMRNKTYPPYTGLIDADADQTILNIGRLANQGMKSVDDMIVKTMIDRKY